MTTKSFELRDSATFMPVIAMQLDPVDERDRFLLDRAGYGHYPSAQREYVILIDIVGQRCAYDPYGWNTGARTLPAAHQYISEHFDDLENGAVVDVEFILGLTPKPKLSEQETQNDQQV